MDELLTIKQFAEKHPAFPQGTLRAFVLYARKGLLPDFSKYVVRKVGGRVLLKEKDFFNWIKESSEPSCIHQISRNYQKKLKEKK